MIIGPADADRAGARPLSHRHRPIKSSEIFRDCPKLTRSFVAGINDE
jgi:hypothetical protein